MRRLSILIATLAVWPLFGQSDALKYKIGFDPSRDVSVYDKKSNLYVKVKFTVTAEGNAPSDPNAEFKIAIEENRHVVYEDQLFQPTPMDLLSVVLAVDISGSMKQNNRIDAARRAANAFLENLSQKADCGLILFDHEIEPGNKYPPSLDRAPLRKAVKEMQPRGGTAFLDAAMEGIAMLEAAPKIKERYLVLMTDGVDLNSAEANTLDAVIKRAIAAKVRIYTIGIGEPGKQEQVNTVLVLDQSGSMKAPAETGDKTPKIEGLRRAASRFAQILPTTGFASLIRFSTLVGRPTEFMNDRKALIGEMALFQPEGETALLDATYAGICTLEAAGPPGKRAVIAMTDGIDNCSRHRIKEVVDRAKEAKIKVYTLGFGREGELDAKLMTKLATETGGSYHYAKNEKSLLKIFEDLSIELHDDGIDEITLKEMAIKTGGQFYAVKDADKLQFVLKTVNELIRFKEYEIEFPSKFQQRDGTNREVRIKLLWRSGQVNEAGGGYKSLTDTTSNYQMRGLVVAEMHPLVYLLLLAGLGFLLLLPSILRWSPGERRA